MNTANAMLGGIHLWLKERGIKTTLNLNYERGRACFASAPNISVVDSRIFLKIDGQHLYMGRATHDDQGQLIYSKIALLELSDPAMLDDLEELLGTHHANTP